MFNTDSTGRRKFLKCGFSSFAGFSLLSRPFTAFTAQSVGGPEPGGWANGGTAGMRDIGSYPDPFINAAPQSVVSMPTCAMTQGPCYDRGIPEREDISEGKNGLPMRLGFRIVDEDYQPVTDADVDIWHCDADGIYSSETVPNVTFCTGDDPAALAARFFRGHRMTNADGVAWFNSCMPGWYGGRAVHIHATIKRSDHQGEEFLTTQFAFPQDFLEYLFNNHSDYRIHGQPRTSYEADFVFEMDSLDTYTFNIEQMSDGTLMAWTTIMIRSDLSDQLCKVGLDRPAGRRAQDSPIQRPF